MKSPKAKLFIATGVAAAFTSGVVVGKYITHPVVIPANINEPYLDKVVDTLNLIKVTDDNTANVIFSGEVTGPNSMVTIIIFEGPCKLNDMGHPEGDTRPKASIAATAGQIKSILPKLNSGPRHYMEKQFAGDAAPAPRSYSNSPI